MARTPLTRNAVSLLEACEDKRLLGVWLYPRQRELLELVEGNPTTIALAGRQGGRPLRPPAFSRTTCSCEPRWTR